MPAEITIQYDATPTDLTVTGLASLADAGVWNSGPLTPGNPAPQIARVSYELIFNATPIAGDLIEFYVGHGDDASSNEVVSGNLGTVGALGTAAARAEALAACRLVWSHFWQTSHGSTFRGVFDVFNPGPDWRLLIRPVGEAFSSGTQRVRVRYGSPEYQG